MFSINFIFLFCLLSFFSPTKGECRHAYGCIVRDFFDKTIIGFHFESQYGVEPQFTPFLAQDNRVYVVSKEGDIHCFNQNKKLLWKETTHKVDLSSPPSFTPEGSVCFLSQNGDIVYLKEDGTPLSIYPGQGQQFFRPVFDNFGHVYFMSQFGAVYKIDEKGVGSFEKTLFSPFSQIAAFPFFTDQNMYWTFVVNRKDILNFDSKDNIYFGKFTCTNEENINTDSFVLDADKNTFFVTNSNCLKGVECGGTIFLEHYTPCSIASPIAIDQEGLIYFGGSDKKLYCVDPNSESVCTIYAGDRVSQAPQVGLDGRVFFLTDTGYWLWTADPFVQLWHKGERISEEPFSLAPLPKKIPEIAFGAKEWEEYFGIVDEEPPLPKNIDEILSSPCPFWPEKKVRDTHLLVLIPKSVGGAPLTLNALQRLIEQPQKGRATKYSYYDSYVKNELGDKGVEKSYWLLMTADVIPNSRSKSYQAQKKLLQDYAKKSSLAYSLPTALEVATAILTHYVTHGKRLYPNSPLTYTRCQEKICSNKYTAVVGGFSSAGVGVDDYYYFGNAYFGVGGVRKFGHGD